MRNIHLSVLTLSGALASDGSISSSVSSGRTRRRSSSATLCTQETCTCGAQDILGPRLSFDVGRRVLGQRDSRMAPLLRAPVHEPVFADVQIPFARSTLPDVAAAVCQVALEVVLVLHR